MAAAGLEQEVLEALNCIKQGKNFILQGGAGSGKTYSLISLIKELFRENPSYKILCITFTNNAVAEIVSRVDNNNLTVSTIHEFIWSLIKKYQNEIKKVLVSLINADSNKYKKPQGIEGEITIDYFSDKYVDYDEYYSMTPKNDNKVKISHNDILVVAEKLFENYPKLSDILKDIADYIFIDEYQDTDPLVINILLIHLKKSKKQNIIGFFGDSMQAIYDDGVVDINKYLVEKTGVEDYRLEVIIKEQNRRNPKIVIDIANKFRNDGLIQIPSSDTSAPNMDNREVIKGSVTFLYGSENLNYDIIKKHNIFKSWDFSNGQDTKELRLTHRLNAKSAGFENLYNLYNDDPIDKLIQNIKEKLEKINDTGEKTLDEYAVEYRKPSNERDVINKKLMEIMANEDYRLLYNQLKSIPMKDIFTKYSLNSDSLLSYKLNGATGQYEAKSSRDKILLRLDLLEEMITLYNEKKYNEFLKKTKYRITDKEDKVKLKNIMDDLSNNQTITIGTALEDAVSNGLLQEDDRFTYYISNDGWCLWQRIKNIEYREYRNSIKYLNEYSSLCTQHSVKGSEYNNVFVILDAANWKKYNFNTLFGKGSSNIDVIKRTQRLFYVCITRAKQNLVIFMPTDDAEIINKAKEYFGAENVMKINEE